MIDLKDTKRYARVKDMPSLYPAFTEKSIRNLIYASKTNGFDCCLRRIGRRIIIDLDVFEHWIEQNKIKK